MRISEFEFPQPTKSDVAVEDILLLGGDPMLDDLFIDGEDLTLAKEFPESRENKPVRVGTVGKEGKASGFTVHWGMPLLCLLMEEELVPKLVFI